MSENSLAQLDQLDVLFQRWSKYHTGALKWTLAHSLGAMSVETVKQIQFTDNTHHFIEKVARARARSK